jgi:peptide deformylase
MAVCPILVWGNPRLEAANQPVTNFGPELAQLIQDLFETGWRAPGLGVAAPQIGVNEIVSTEGSENLEEGCLSFPGLFTTIPRPRRLRVHAQDEAGQWRTIVADGLLAQAVCHEVDHLDGVLLVNHLRGLKKQLFVRRVAKARKLGVWPETA